VPSPILCSYRSPTGRHGCSRPAAYLDPTGLMYCPGHAADRAAETVMTPTAAALVGVS
jgi:hypothetical protein